jgi:DNA-directed RNA polymerase subunit M/transcription elongation factor TFIIS
LKPSALLRAASVAKIFEALAVANPEPGDREKYARRAETRVYQAYRCDRERYVRAMRKIVWNVSNNAARIYSEYPDPSVLPALGDRELGKGTLAEKFVLDNEDRERKLREINAGRGGLEESGRTLLRCHRTPTCRNAKVTWDQAQSRGADEASTIYATCTNCGATWKM